MPETKPHDLVVLFSGGYDSTLLMHLAKDTGHNPIALLVDYGQAHKRELTAAVRTCRKLAVPYRQMAVALTGIDSGLTGSGEQGQYRGVHTHHVPGRNTIFVGLAMSLAESIGATKIWYGANMEDCYNQFSDCTQQWVYAMNSATKTAASYPIELEAPLLGMRKETIQKLGTLLGVDEADVHSGYAI
jgi:7-cyano-7-deazaguanine synthase